MLPNLQITEISFKTCCTETKVVEDNQTKNFEQLVRDQQDLHVLRSAAICSEIKMGIANE